MNQQAPDIAAWNWWPLPAALLLATLVLIPIFLVLRAQRQYASPDRLKAFLRDLEGIDWRGERRDALNGVAKAIVGLFLGEIEYYYRLRVRRSAVAMVTRGLAFVLGTAGLLSPLIIATLPDGPWPRASQFGYIMIAAAAAALAANQLFGGTFGHIQFVKAQYKLEQLIHDFEVKWQQWQEKANIAALDERAQARLTAKAFALFRELSSESYEVIASETAAWAENVMAAEAQLGSSLRRQPPTAA